MQPPPSIATLRVRRAATHAPNAPRPSLSHISLERAPPKRAPMPPPFCHPGQGANSQHPSNAPQGRTYPAQPPWHPNSPQPLSFERPNRRAPPTNPHHLHTIQSLPCTQSKACHTCCCCCRPAAPTPLAMAYAGLLKTRWGLASSIEITPSGHQGDCDLLAARCEPSTAACVTP